MAARFKDECVIRARSNKIKMHATNPRTLHIYDLGREEKSASEYSQNDAQVHIPKKRYIRGNMIRRTCVYTSNKQPEVCASE